MRASREWFTPVPAAIERRAGLWLNSGWYTGSRVRGKWGGAARATTRPNTHNKRAFVKPTARRMEDSVVVFPSIVFVPPTASLRLTESISPGPPGATRTGGPGTTRASGVVVPWSTLNWWPFFKQDKNALTYKQSHVRLIYSVYPKMGQ